MNTSSDLASRPRTEAPHVLTSAASLAMPPSFTSAWRQRMQGRGRREEGRCGTIPSMVATWEEFERLEVAVGQIVEVGPVPGTRKPFHALTIDFGPRGMRRSAAQITHYPEEELV